MRLVVRASREVNCLLAERVALCPVSTSRPRMKPAPGIKSSAGSRTGMTTMSWRCPSNLSAGIALGSCRSESTNISELSPSDGLRARSFSPRQVGSLNW